MSDVLILDRENPRSKPHPPDAKAPVGNTVASPFSVVADSREQQPYKFEGLLANADQKHAVIKVPVERRALEVGDYSIHGMTDLITIERKSKEDLYSSISQRRENFEQRLKKMCLEYTIAFVVVEAGWDDLLLNPPKHTQFNPKSLSRTIDAWMIRWPRVHWVMMPGRDMAEAKTYRLLERFYWAYREGKWFEAERYAEAVAGGNQNMGFDAGGGLR